MVSAHCDNAVADARSLRKEESDQGEAKGKDKAKDGKQAGKKEKK